MRRARLPLVALALTLAACATLGLEPLRFGGAGRDAELRLLLPSSGRPYGGAAIRMWARVENPNSFGLRLAEVVGDLAIEDAEAIAVEFPLGLPLVAYQDTVIPLDVSLDFDDLPRLASIARAALGGGSLSYRLDGTFAIDAGALGRPRFGPATLLTGEVDVLR